ncbi:hypothetical protein HDU91_002169, partial [Kappamyces sp. JEL0680]
MWSSSQIDGEYLCVVPHPSLRIIAAATPDGNVVLYEEDLQESQNLSVKKDHSLQQLSWHPTRKFLIIAWSNGTLGLWCPESDTTFREGNIHSSLITSVAWSPTGNRLITGDSDGTVVIWKVDGRGKLSTLTQYRLRGSIQQITFKSNASRLKDT